MQIIQKILPASLPYQFLANKSIKDNNILLFDIETTGFSPDISSIYLIGCCYYENDNWNMKQYFADDYISEQSILQSFLDFAKDFKVMIHYNGSGFDIPYLQKKLLHYKIDFSFESFLQIDLYKKIFPYKKILDLPNLKQKTLENFLGLPRKDECSDGELIEVYVAYMKDKFGKRSEMDAELEKLLLHNEEDVTNLICLTSILAYCDLFEEALKIQDVQKSEPLLVISFQIANSLPRPFAYRIPGVSLDVSSNTGQLRITYLETELKYFYSNHKDYYYLPAEDTALHKSVAEFVDKQFREKAKAATCYTRKTGLFLPQFFGNLKPSFRHDYKEKENYVELTDEFLNDSEKCSEYASILIQALLHYAKKLK